MIIAHTALSLNKLRDFLKSHNIKAKITTAICVNSTTEVERCFVLTASEESEAIYTLRDCEEVTSAEYLESKELMFYYGEKLAINKIAKEPQKHLKLTKKQAKKFGNIEPTPGPFWIVSKGNKGAVIVMQQNQEYYKFLSRCLVSLSSFSILEEKPSL